MGIGMMLIVEKESVEQILNLLNREEKNAYLIGEIVEGSTEVIL